jgi:hypothetical protein
MFERMENEMTWFECILPHSAVCHGNEISSDAINSALQLGEHKKKMFRNGRAFVWKWDFVLFLCIWYSDWRTDILSYYMSRAKEIQTPGHSGVFLSNLYTSDSADLVFSIYRQCYTTAWKQISQKFKHSHTNAWKQVRDSLQWFLQYLVLLNTLQELASK